MEGGGGKRGVGGGGWGDQKPTSPQSAAEPQ